MPRYLLATHTAIDADPPTSMSPEDMERFMGPVRELEADMKEQGVWVFSARLHEPASATVVRHEDARTVLADGPYVESKEHVAGFYVIEAADLDEALRWADRVVGCIERPIEVRPIADWAA